MKKINEAVEILKAAVFEETGVKDGLTRICFSPKAFDEYLIDGAKKFSYHPSDVNNAHINGVKLDARERHRYE